MNFADHERPRPTLNIAPLIDVVFLLLVFFMLASSFIEPTAIDLSMPETADRPRTGGNQLVIDITVAGRVSLNGLVLKLDQVGPELLGRVDNRPDRPVTVRAEAEVPVQILVSVMDRVRGTGLKNIRLATPRSP
jgi:biopolymer transport protein ExbD